MKAKSTVFIDANIFIYHFTGASDESSSFLSQCESGIFKGITSTNVILEVLHRLMIVEAVHKRLFYPPNLVNKLKKHPERIKQLHDYFTNTQKIEQMGILVRPISALTILKSQINRSRYGLMVNDSIIVTIMEEEGISYLVTHDKDFNSVTDIKVLSPQDIDL
ncbi:MAG: PIN domain-containing protein [Deltaproteobacteria bacterium]|nr:PIN domain-containing protein [Deltaproteobacteria bacterium]